jgi:hypothetical protein
MLPCYCHHTAATTTLLPPLHCRVRHHVTTKLPPPPLPPCHHHRHHLRWRCQAVTAATKLPPLPLSTLQDKFDDEKEFCNMTDIKLSALLHHQSCNHIPYKLLVLMLPPSCCLSWECWRHVSDMSVTCRQHVKMLQVAVEC